MTAKNIFYKKPKYNAQITKSGDKVFSSKLEASYFRHLEVLQKTGEVLFFIRQTRFDLPGSIKYFLDFTVFYCNGEVEFIDVKGFDTDISKLKRKQVEDLYPIEIIIIKKGDF